MAVTAAPDRTVDVVVIGGGSAGYACAIRASELDLEVVVVEEDRLGGTCLHTGCIPTKALLHAAEVADAVRTGERFGIRATLDAVDVDQLLTYQRGVVDTLHRGLQGLLRSRRVDVVPGTGRLTGPRTVEVQTADGTVVLTARRGVVLATGARPATLPHVRPDGERVLTSDQALALDRVPASVVVIGGGAIGSEFASAWASLGARVTLVEALDRLLPEEEPSSSSVLQSTFTRRGIDVRTGRRLTTLEHTADGVRVELDDGSELAAEVALVAVGRTPRSDGLGLAEVGVELDGGWVRTDDRHASTVPGVWAVGDLVRGLQLAHRGFAHGIAVAERIAGAEPAVVDDVQVPRVAYCDPEVASVGETSAAARGRLGTDAVEVLRYDLAGNGRTRILGGAGATTVVRQVDGPVLGIHLVGPGVGELIGEAQLITAWGAWPEEVAPLVHAHPTRSEALGEAHLALAGKPLHVHR